MKKQLLHVLILILLFLSFEETIFCMESPSLIEGSKDRKGLWISPLDSARNNMLITLNQTEENLRQMDNFYQHQPTDTNGPLDKERVLNRYWIKIGLQDQKHKDSAFSYVLGLNFTTLGYPLQRFHYAAAVLVGANPNTADGEALSSAVLMQDYPLCKILLEHQASPNIKYFGKPVIFHIQKTKLAELFLQYDVDIKAASQNKDNLLGQVMDSDYESQLIPLYKSKGASPVHTDENGTNALHHLAFKIVGYSDKYPLLFAKVHALFEGLSQREINALMYAQQRNNGTVFDFLRKHEEFCPTAKVLIGQLEKYRKL